MNRYLPGSYTEPSSTGTVGRSILILADWPSGWFSTGGFTPTPTRWPAMPEPHVHEWVDIQRLGDPEPVYICSRCGAARGDR